VPWPYHVISTLDAIAKLLLDRFGRSILPP
jgi:hypothetical protein